MKKPCCELLDLALTRSASKTGKNPGFELATIVTFNSGKHKTEIIYRFPKAPRGDRTKYANTTYAKPTHCPFCGKAFLANPDYSCGVGGNPQGPQRKGADETPSA